MGAAMLYRETWFFPAAMVVVGSHYLPFITLYGMKMFGILAGILVIVGAVLGLYGPDIFSLGGWLTGIVLITFAFIGRQIVLSEEKNIWGELWVWDRQIKWCTEIQCKFIPSMRVVG